MGCGPTHKQHTGVGHPGVTGRSEAREGPDVRCSSDFRRFGSGGLRSDVRSGSDIRGVCPPEAFENPVIWLRCGGAGRPERAGRPVPGGRRTSGVRRSFGAWEFRAVLLVHRAWRPHRLVCCVYRIRGFPPST